MSNFIKIQPYVEVKVPNYFDEEREVDVIINIRVSDDGFIYFGPMECSGSIHKNKTMCQLKSEFIKSYENQGYKYVEVTEVLIDKNFLEELKADAKVSNKKESEKLSKFIHAFIDSSLQADA
jgi:hypothetical protein